MIDWELEQRFRVTPPEIKRLEYLERAGKLILDDEIRKAICSPNIHTRVPSALSSYSTTKREERNFMVIEKVIFNDPATIVIWADGTKTIVKVQEGDTFDPEKGLAMAISKKALGNKGNYCEIFKRWTKEV